MSLSCVSVSSHPVPWGPAVAAPSPFCGYLRQQQWGQIKQAIFSYLSVTWTDVLSLFEPLWIGLRPERPSALPA